MKVSYLANPTFNENRIINQISSECGILYDTARLLFDRKIDSVEKAQKFLHPERLEYYNPSLLFGMKEAVERIKFAKEHRQNVLIFGDYDADGISAVTTLYYCLKDFNLETSVAVPERKDGYGLNVDRIEKMNNERKIDLLITVDCGISENEKIENIKNLGIDVIVTDHHEPPEILPDCICINPKIKNQDYPFDGLCGAGVAYKLGYALIGERANDYIDYVALATVADSMDLIDENRKIVYYGLKLFNSSKCRTSFKYLLGDNKKEITAQTLAFVLAPRVNAGGRMGDANSTLNLFLSKDDKEIFDLSVKTNEYNIARQNECDNIYREASNIISEQKLYEKEVILVKNDNWGAGFIGIVAAKLVEDYNRPVIVFSKADNFYKGSARSVDGINIYQAILSASDCLIAFGGHSQAAGVSVSADNFYKFEDSICKYVRENCKDIDSEKTIYAEWELNSEMDLHFAEEINLLEPFGTGNKKPLFIIRVNSVCSNPLREGSNHYLIKAFNMDLFDFNGVDDVLTLSLPTEKIIVFEAGVSEFKHVKSVKGIIKKIISNNTSYSAIDLDIFRNELLRIKNGDNKNFSIINKSDVKIEKGYGTIYAVSKYENLLGYSVNGVNTYLFSPEEKKPFNCIVVSPENIQEGFEKVIYLDKPISVLECSAKNYVVNDVLGSCDLGDLSLDRKDFTTVYNFLLENEYQQFVTSADFYRKNSINGISPRQFVFAFEVFFELGFFYIKSGKLFVNKKIKSQLDNSKIYSAISSIRGKI